MKSLLLYLRAAFFLVLVAPFGGHAATVTNCLSFENFKAGVIQDELITFDCSGTIVFTNGVLIRGNTVIDGGNNDVTLDGGYRFTNSSGVVFGIDGLFKVTNGATLTLTNLTLANCFKTNNGGAIHVYSGGTLIASGCTFSNNTARGNPGAAGANGLNGSVNGNPGGGGGSGTPIFGGAIYNFGTSVLDHCTFESNQAVGGDGGNGGNGGNVPSDGFRGGKGGSGGSGGAALGGAVYNLGSISLTNCTFSGNSVSGGNAGSGGTGGTGPLAGYNGNGGSGGAGSGAGLYNLRFATIGNCVFLDNAGEGGNSTTGGTQDSGNGSNGASGGDSLGGGIFNSGTNVLINCTFSTNQLTAGNGGNGGNADGGRAGNGGSGGVGAGGGLYNIGRVLVTNCTFAGGSASGGLPGMAGTGSFLGTDGGLGASRGGNIANGAGLFFLNNSILASPSSGTNTLTSTNVSCNTNITTTTNIVGGITNTTSTTNIVCSTNAVTSTNFASSANSFGTVSNRYCICSDASLTPLASTSRKNTDAKLEGLEDNGGLTMTFGLLPDSPAVDAADPETCGYDDLEFDQRGVERPYGDGCDMGAYELQVSSIRGLISDSLTATAVTGVVVTAVASGGLTYSTVSTNGGDFGWDFELSRLPAGADTNLVTYDLTPSHPDYEFDPETNSVTLGRDVNTDPLFIAYAIYSISGRITILEDGVTNGLKDVTLTALDADLLVPHSGVSGTNGNYKVTGVRAGTDITLTPELVGFRFEPPFREGGVSGNLTNMDFRAVPTNYFVSGHITAITGTNSYGVAGITVSVASDTAEVTAITDTNGFYRTARLPAGTYLAQPSGNLYDFDFPDGYFIDLTADRTDVDFRVISAYSISGSLTNQGGVGISDAVTVDLFMGTNRVSSTQSLPDGSYAIPQVGPGTYTVVPSPAAYVFNPPSRDVTVAPSASGVDFGAIPLLTISGRVIKGTNGLGGVTVSALTAGFAAVQRATSDTNTGTYTITNVPAGSNSVFAFLGSFQFDPNPFVTNLTMNATGVDFAVSYSISGTIKEGTNGVSNVPVMASNWLAGVVRTNATDTNGNYTIPGVRSGTNVVRPLLSGYTYTPAFSNVVINSNSASAVNFSAVGNLSIGGIITNQSGVGVTNVTVSVGTKSAVSSNSGAYLITGLSPKTYTVNPTRSGFGFNPASRMLTLPDTNSGNVSFLGFPVFLISGTVFDGATGKGLTNATVSDGLGHTATAGANGNYVLANVAGGQNVVFTPSFPGYRFTPAFRDLPVNANLSGINFTGVVNLHILSGFIRNKDGVGVKNVVVTVGDKPPVSTDTNGEYRVTGLVDDTYFVSPSSSVEYVFTPALQFVPVSSDTSNVNFLASGPYSVSGHITNAATGNPLPGVLVRAGSLTNITGADGSYTIDEAPSGSSSVTPTLAGYTFSPTNRTITLPPNPSDIDFLAYPVHSISGFVLNETNGPLSNATIRVVTSTPARTNTVTTSTNGSYTLTGIPDGANVITATFPGFGFDPESYSTNLTANINNLNFTGFQSFSISGRLTEATIGATNILVTASNLVTMGVKTAVSDINGNYVISGLHRGTNAVFPGFSGYDFTPVLSNAVITTANMTGVNFTGKGILSISGVITDQNGGLVPNITVTASNLAVSANSRATTTGSDGRYTITNLSPRSHFVLPSPTTRYVFNPASVNVLLPIITDLNFTALQKFTINGRVLDEANSPLASVAITNVTASPATTNSTVTDANGNYSLTGVREGTNSVTPFKLHYEFGPASTNFLLKSDTNIAFIGTNLFFIQGNISENGFGGVSNVLVLASNIVTGIVRTNSTGTNGNYLISGLRAGTNNVIARRAGYVFSPTNQSVVVGPGDGAANFTASGNFTLSGRVTKHAVGVSGVNVSAGGRNGVSDANGFYIINNLSPHVFVVTPSLANNTFSPLSPSVSLEFGSVAQDFTAIPVFTVQGRVTTTNGSVAGLAGVSINAFATVPPTTNNAITDANGNYTLFGVPESNNILTPSLCGYVFTPSQLSTNVSTNITSGLDFVARPGFRISGRITEGNNAVPGVTVNVGSASGVSGSDGTYSIVLNSGGNVIVQPAAPNGLVFEPDASTNTINSANCELAGVDFTARARLTLLLFNGQPQLTIHGVPSHSYLIQATTNQLWQTIWTTNVDALTGLSDFLDSSSTNFPSRLYRTRTP